MLLSGLVPPRDMEIVYRDGRRETLPWTSGIADHASPHLSQAECENNMVFETDFFIRAVNGEADVKQYQQISLDTMMFMDEVRRKIGLSFPADDSV